MRRIVGLLLIMANVATLTVNISKDDKSMIVVSILGIIGASVGLGFCWEGEG